MERLRHGRVARVNHEYVSGRSPTVSRRPGSTSRWPATCASLGVLTNDVESNVWSQADVDTYIRWEKREVGGSWLRTAGPGDGRLVGRPERDRRALRRDEQDAEPPRGARASSPGHDDTTGAALAGGLVAGIMGDAPAGRRRGARCTAEENVQDYW